METEIETETETEIETETADAAFVAYFDGGGVLALP